MPFCERCKSLVMARGGAYKCAKCGFEGAAVGSKPVTIAREERDILVLDEEARKKLEVMPTIRIECPKCGNFEAYFRTQQTRKSDEPETMFLRCAKCDNRWRKY